MPFSQGASYTRPHPTQCKALGQMGEGWEQPLSLKEAAQLSQVTDVIHNAKLGLQQRRRGGHRHRSPED